LDVNNLAQMAALNFQLLAVDFLLEVGP